MDLPALQIQPVDIPGAIYKGYQQGTQIRQQQAKYQAGQLAAQGNMEGAQSVALASGDLDTVSKLNQLSAQQLEVARQRNEGFAKLASDYLNAPQTDKPAAFAYMLHQAQVQGVPQSIISNAVQGANTSDPASMDRVAQTVLGNSQSLAEKLDLQMKAKAYDLQTATLENTKAYQQAELGLSQQRLGIEAGSLAETQKRDQMLYGEDMLMSPKAIDFAARQTLAGDPSGLQNVGKGTQGSHNLSAIRNRLTEIANEEGISPQKLAQIDAEFFGIKAAERTVGTRQANVDMAANELLNFGNQALQASSAVPRSNWLAFTQAWQAGQRQFNDPALQTLASKVQAWKNAYATLMGRGGVPTVDANKRADELISSAQNAEALAASVRAGNDEAIGAKSAATQVRTELGNSITGSPAASSPSSSAPALAPAPAPALKPSFRYDAQGNRIP